VIIAKAPPLKKGLVKKELPDIIYVLFNENLFCNVAINSFNYVS
jgi:hypothetical protein